jgi:O-antigen/teichoic acid export membrane protein
MLVNQAGYSEMGVFNAANQWKSLLIFIPDIVGRTIMPMISSFYSTRDLSSARKTLGASIAVTGLFSLPIALALIVGSNAVMSIYGPEFIGRGMMLTVVAITIALLGIQAPIGQVIAASGRMWLGALMNIVWALIVLAANVWFLDKGYGAAGLAASFLCAYVVLGIWAFSYAFTVHGTSKRETPVPQTEINE